MNTSVFCDTILHLSKLFSLPNFSGLASHLPVFPIFSEQIDFLSKPHEFYDELLSQASVANKRIIMASLYLGSGKLEKDLVDTVFRRLHSYPEIKNLWLLDYTRAFRGKVNSCTLLLPLIQDKNLSCKVSLFHTPNLRGLTKLLLPERWNEIIGLQHMKIYVFDNSVILSGANLSNDYFVNRQDRYVLIKDCKELADFYEGLVSLLSSHSFQLKPDSTVDIEGSVHPYKGSRQQYISSVSNAISKFWTEEMKKSSSRLKVLADALTLNCEGDRTNQPDTLLLPTIQIPQCGIKIDSEATASFVQNTPDASKICLATGYFNITNQIADILLYQSRSAVNILCAHPKANGFLGARGSAGGIPAAYTNLCKQFYHRIVKNSLTDRISVYEYQKDGWTFHAKGLWYFPPDSLLPSTTLIGSPNFGYRSVHRDLETHLFISTLSPSLRKEMAEEQATLYQPAALVTPSTFDKKDRIVPLWVKLVTRFFKYFF